MDLPEDYLKRFELKSRVSYEYEVLCSENEQYFGKGIWSIPRMVGVTDVVLREAIGIAHKRGIHSVGYLRGIIKKLIK